MLVVPGRPRRDRQGRRHRRRRRGRRWPGCTSASTTLRRPRRRRRSASPSRSTPSGSSPRTRSFPVTYRGGKTAHLDVGGRRGEAHPARRRGPARRHRRRRQAGRPRRLGGSTPLRLRLAGDPDTLRVREALRDEPRPGRPLVQARPDDPLRPARGRGAVPDRAPARAVRGLRAAGDARRRHPDGRAARHRRADARARVPARHRVLRRRRRDRRRRGRRPDHRRGPRPRAPAVGRRPRPPRHQAGQPAGPATATSSSSTSPSPRCARRRGGRPSTSPT